MLRHLASWICAALFACSPLSLQAAPFSVTGDSGKPGDSVEVGLFVQDANILTATIEVLFDDSVLSFTGARLGDLLSHPPLGAAPFEPPVLNAMSGGRAVISLVGLEDVSGSGELLGVSFAILAAAPAGDTFVSFQCSNAATCEFDYDIPLTTGAVAVLDLSSPVPTPSPALLFGFGLATILLVRMKT
jgi:hypothetical protein